MDVRSHRHEKLLHLETYFPVGHLMHCFTFIKPAVPP